MSWLSDFFAGPIPVIKDGLRQLGDYFSGATSANISASRSGNLARLNNELAKDYSTWSAKYLPSYTIEGMEKAGINPIIAYSSGFGGGSNPASFKTAPSSASSVNAHSEGLSSILSALLSVGSVGSNMTMQAAQAALLKAQARATDVKTTYDAMRNSAVTASLIRRQEERKAGGSGTTFMNDLSQIAERVLHRSKADEDANAALDDVAETISEKVGNAAKAVGGAVSTRDLGNAFKRQMDLRTNGKPTTSPRRRHN